MEFDGRAHTQNEIATRLEMVLRFLTDQMWPFKDLDSIEYSTPIPFHYLSAIRYIFRWNLITKIVKEIFESIGQFEIRTC